MKDSEIYTLVTERLVDNAPYAMDVVLSNADCDPVKPYLTIDVVPTDRTNRSLSGGFETSMGFVQITLVSETNEDESQILEQAELIAAIFPNRLRLGNELLVKQPPMIENGYRDGPDWRTPIRIDYQTHSQT